MTHNTSATPSVLLAAIFVVLFALPFSWVPAGTLGAFNMRLPYAAVMLLVLAVLLCGKRLGSVAYQMPGLGLVWIGSYLCYLLILKMALAGYPDKGIIMRQVVFIFSGTMFATALFLSSAAPGILRKGALAAVAGFVLITEYMAWQLGMSWLVAVERFLIGGDLHFVTYGFFREIFRNVTDASAEIPAAEKNLVAAAILLAMIFYRMAFTGRGVDWTGRALTILCLGLLFMLNTRSVLLTALIILLIAFIATPPSQRAVSMPRLVIKGLIGVTFTVAVLIITISNDTLIPMLGERFAFDDASAGGRLDQFGFAIVKANENFLWGVGLREINGQTVHNLFLSAWMHAGIFAFLLVFVAYVSIATSWIRFVARLALGYQKWALPLRAEWVAALPVLPLFRAWVAGDAGHPGLYEWLCLFSFFAILQINRRQIRGAPIRAWMPRPVLADDPNR